ncbi:hypothetical protein GQ457_08G031890 [Hibiscus cannabinus]
MIKSWESLVQIGIASARQPLGQVHDMAPTTQAKHVVDLLSPPFECLCEHKGYRYSTKEGIDTRPWVSIPGMGIDTQKPYWNSGIGFAHNRVSILKGGYRVSGYRYHKGGIDTKMPGRHI